MCVLDMDEKGNLFLYKFALLCKDEIIKRLINGSYNLTEPSVGSSTIGNSLINLFSWQDFLLTNQEGGGDGGHIWECLSMLTKCVKEI